jgi:hypothetical protein
MAPCWKQVAGNDKKERKKEKHGALLTQNVRSSPHYASPEIVNVSE